VLDGGPCPVGIESTIVACLAPGAPVLLRPGGLTRPERLAEGAATGRPVRSRRSRASAPAGTRRATVSARCEGVFGGDAERLAAAFWPGPLTLVVPVAPDGRWAISGLNRGRPLAA
jgi:L-threonylcarbamoyladenylate synthase